MRVLRVFNRQKSRSVNVALLRQVAKHLLEKSRARHDYELAVHLIDATEMANINETILGNSGSTDVITFDHKESAENEGLRGELFISVDDAVTQAHEFKQTWPSEIVRYVAHGVLHLEGYDDLQPAARRRMKREENKLVKDLSRQFDLGKLARVKDVSGYK